MTLAIYRTLAIFGACAGLIVGGVYELTAPAIARGREAARQEAVLRVLPGAVRSRTFVRGSDGRFAPATAPGQATHTVFAGYDGQGRLVGVAVQAEGPGYQDVLRVLYGYAIDRQAVVGLQVLESRETPGLGDRIEKDPVFLRNFEALEVRVSPDGRSVATPIEFVKRGDKTAAHQIDSITGATVSAKAIATILRGSTGSWVPRLAAQRGDFEGGSDG